MRSLLRGLLVLALVLVPVSCDDDDPLDLDDADIGVELIAQGLTSPVALVEAPDASNRLFVADLTGFVRIVDAQGTLLATPFLDLRSRLVTVMPGYDERGVLGLAFHPQFSSNGRFYVFYSAPLRAGAPAGFDHTAHISEFTVTPASANTASLASERILLQVDQPQLNHNGGTLAFGPDGLLYISLGDGGGSNDVGTGHVNDWYTDNAGGNGQDITQNLLGSILRIDVGGDPYDIPADNPFVGEAGLDEIWAYGFRNPYRMSFDQGGTRRLIAGDAGQDLWEEVSVVTAGGNYGWNVKEGAHCFDTDDPDTSPTTCPDEDPDGTPLIDPVIEFANSRQPGGGLGATVVGGHVYRGDDVDALDGLYLFAVWSSGFMPDGRVFAAQPVGGTWPFQEVLFANTTAGRLDHFVLGFGQDNDGEVYILTTDSEGPSGTSGRVYRIIEVD